MNADPQMARESAAWKKALCDAVVKIPVERGYKPKRYDFDGFDEKTHPEVEAMFKEAQWFINDVVMNVRPRRWLSLLGASGAGKTHVAKAIADAICKERPKMFVQFWTWQKVVELLRKGKWDFLDQIKREVDVLILDDIGAENSTPAIKSSLNDLCNYRLNKWTVLTSNLSSAQIGDELDMRIASRLFRGDNVIVQLKTADDWSYKHKISAEGAKPTRKIVFGDEVGLCSTEEAKAPQEAKEELLSHEEALAMIQQWKDELCKNKRLE